MVISYFALSPAEIVITSDLLGVTKIATGEMSFEYSLHEKRRNADKQDSDILEIVFICLYKR